MSYATLWKVLSHGMHSEIPPHHSAKQRIQMLNPCLSILLCLQPFQPKSNQRYQIKKLIFTDASFKDTMTFAITLIVKVIVSLKLVKKDLFISRVKI